MLSPDGRWRWDGTESLRAALGLGLPLGAVPSPASVRGEHLCSAYGAGAGRRGSRSRAAAGTAVPSRPGRARLPRGSAGCLRSPRRSPGAVLEPTAWSSPTRAGSTSGWSGRAYRPAQPLLAEGSTRVSWQAHRKNNPPLAESWRECTTPALYVRLDTLAGRSRNAHRNERVVICCRGKNTRKPPATFHDNRRRTQGESDMRVPSAPAVTSPSGPESHRFAMADDVCSLRVTMARRMGHATHYGPGGSVVC